MNEPQLQSLSLAAHYLSIERPQRALETLAQVDEALVDTALFWELRAQALFHLERHAEAAEAAAQGLERDGEDVDLMRLHADSLAHLGRLAEAERVALRALALQPEDASLLCSYAFIAARGDQLDKAARLAERAAELAPESRRVEATRLLLAHLRGEGRKARGHARALLADAPEDAGAHYLAAVAEAHDGRASVAARHLLVAARLDPGDRDFAEAARQARFETHPLLWPLRPFAKLGTAGTWIAAVGAVFGLQALGYGKASAITAMVYVGVCVYSWVMPPLLRRWLRRRRR